MVERYHVLNSNRRFYRCPSRSWSPFDNFKVLLFFMLQPVASGITEVRKNPSSIPWPTFRMTHLSSILRAVVVFRDLRVDYHNVTTINVLMFSLAHRV